MPFGFPSYKDQIKGAVRSAKNGEGLGVAATLRNAKAIQRERDESESRALTSYEVLTEMLMSNSGSFEVRSVRSDGTTHIYRGSDITDFVQRQDDRRHSHEVIDGSGTVLYRRDYNGKVSVGNEAQLRRFALTTNAARRLIG